MNQGTKSLGNLISDQRYWEEIAMDKVFEETGDQIIDLYDKALFAEEVLLESCAAHAKKRSNRKYKAARKNIAKDKNALYSRAFPTSYEPDLSTQKYLTKCKILSIPNFLENEVVDELKYSYIVDTKTVFYGKQTFMTKNGLLIRDKRVLFSEDSVYPRKKAAEMNYNRRAETYRRYDEVNDLLTYKEERSERNGCDLYASDFDDMDKFYEYDDITCEVYDEELDRFNMVSPGFDEGYDLLAKHEDSFLYDVEDDWDQSWYEDWD